MPSTLWSGESPLVGLAPPCVQPHTMGLLVPAGEQVQSGPLQPLGRSESGWLALRFTFPLLCDCLVLFYCWQATSGSARLGSAQGTALLIGGCWQMVGRFPCAVLVPLPRSTFATVFRQADVRTVSPCHPRALTAARTRGLGNTHKGRRQQKEPVRAPRRSDFSVSLAKSNTKSPYSWGGGLLSYSLEPLWHSLPSALGVEMEAGMCAGEAGRRASHTGSQIC